MRTELARRGTDERIRRLHVGAWITAQCLAVGLFLGGSSAAQAASIPVRVVVVTTFELGQDSGDTPGEFQAWVERLPLTDTIDFPYGVRALRYNPALQVLGVVTGGGAINAAASIMALGLDTRFDLSKAYWIVAGIAGVDPNHGSVGSAAWAQWVVDRDLTHEIDAREIPQDWSTGLVPLSRSRPFEAPVPGPGIFTPNVYHLNPGLTEWAYRLTQGVPLEDTAELRQIRARYPDQAPAQAPPHVLKGDEVSAMNWWLGTMMTRTAADWMAYWTGGKGVSVMTAMEDSGILHALQRLAKTGRADMNRVLVLRTAANYSAPAKGESAAQLLASESSSDTATKLSAYGAALEAAYRVGSKVVQTLSAHWEQYAGQPPEGTP